MYDVDAPLESVSDDQLVAAVEGRAGAGRRVEAIKELDRRRAPSRTEALTRVASEPAEPTDVRAAALVALGHQDSAAGRSALAAALGSDEVPIARRAAEALGRVGDRDAISRLASRATNDDPVLRNAIFARSLIAYRHGVDEFRLPRPDEEARQRQGAEGTEPVTVQPPAPDQLERALADLERDLPTMTASPVGALALTCGDSRHIVVLNDELGHGERLDRLDRAPAMPAVVLKLSGGLNRYYLHAYVLTHPGGLDGIDVFVTRTTGDTTIFGSARVADGRLSFTMRALGTRYAPLVDLEGALDGTRLELTAARVLVRPITGARTPPKAGP